MSTLTSRVEVENLAPFSKDYSKVLIYQVFSRPGFMCVSSSALQSDQGAF